MTGLILAAGRGGRLRRVSGDRPKCLVPVGDRTLLERQIRSLVEWGVDRVVIAAGYRADDVQRVAGPRATIVRNEAYASTNSLYSFWLARDAVRGGCVVVNGDVLFHDQLLGDLLTARYDDALLVGARGDAAYSDEEMKVRVRAGRVIDVSKTIASDDADGENVGIARFGADGVALLVEESARIIASGTRTAWLPAAFAAFCRRRPLHAVETRGLPWIEIDFPEDYWRACSDVLPAIDTTDGRRHRAVGHVAAGASRGAQHHV
jgi:choline kinase